MLLSEWLVSTYKMMAGASLAFFFCYYVWGIENAVNAGIICFLGSSCISYWARLRLSREDVA